MNKEFIILVFVMFLCLFIACFLAHLATKCDSIKKEIAIKIVMILFLLPAVFIVFIVYDYVSILSENSNSIEILSEESTYEVVNKQTDRKKITFIVKDVHTNEKLSFSIVDTLVKNDYYNNYKYLAIGDYFIKDDGEIECIENE